jgi:hypothetical protein
MAAINQSTQATLSTRGPAAGRLLLLLALLVVHYLRTKGAPSARIARGDVSGWLSTRTRPLPWHVMSTEHLEELRRRLAEQTHQGSANDRVTTVRLARMRRRLNELEHISENTVGDAAMSAEEEAHEIMDSLENVRDLRPDDG